MGIRLPPRVLDTGPNSKYSQNRVENKRRDPYVPVCRDDLTETQFYIVIVVTCNVNMLCKCSCGGDQNMQR